jgi:two-component system, NtrC family, sensor histidine kinase KinB
MSKTFHPYLPPLRTKIVSRFLWVVGLYAIFGISMIFAVSQTSRMTPRLIHVNYDSIVSAREMKEAWSNFRHPDLDPFGNPTEWKKQFEDALVFEEHNVTEVGEDKIAKDIRALWDRSKNDPQKTSQNDYNQMKRNLAELISVNETGMFHIAQKSSDLGNKVFTGGIIFLFVTIIIVIFLSNGIANRLAYPLKAIAETLRSRPALGTKLKLPAPMSLELKVLNHEMIQMWNNLSELRQLNVEEINTQRNELRTILTFVEDAILVLNTEGVVLHANSGIKKFIDLPLEETIGRQWSDLSTTSENYLHLRTILQSDLTQHQSTQITVDGKKRSLSIRFREIENEKGVVTGTLYLFHDVTDRRQTEKLRREFIGVLSHELKTPLQSLSVCSQLLSEHKNSLTIDGQLLVDTINEDVSRIRAVANDFIQVGVENLSSLKLLLEQVSLDEAIPQWLKPFRVLARDKKINIEFENLCTEKPLAKIDQVKFPWVISNILANSIRISPPDKTINVTIRHSDTEIFIEMADQGPGIPAEIQKRMFDPYFQAATDVGEGKSTGFLGIGLTIAREVVEAHNGTIKFSPNTPTGAIFTVSLPMVHLAGLLP